MLRWRLLLFDLVHHSGASAVVRETDYGCFSMPIWKSNHAYSCIPWSSRPVSSAASPTPRPKKGDLGHVKRPVTREAEQATDARSHLPTDHQDCDPIFAAWLPPPDGPWRPRLAHVDPSRDAPPPHLALLSSQTTTSFSSCHHGIPSRLPLRPRADSLGRSLSLSPADPFSPVRLWSSSCLCPGLNIRLSHRAATLYMSISFPTVRLPGPSI